MSYDVQVCLDAPVADPVPRLDHRRIIAPADPSSI